MLIGCTHSNCFEPVVAPDRAILRARKEARRRFRMARPPLFDLALVQPRAVRSAAHGGPRHPSAKFTHGAFPSFFSYPWPNPPRGPPPFSFSFLVFSQPESTVSPPVESLPGKLVYFIRSWRFPLMDVVNNISIVFMLHRYVAEYVTRVTRRKWEALRAESGLKIIMRRTTGCAYPRAHVLLIHVYNK